MELHIIYPDQAIQALRPRNTPSDRCLSSDNSLSELALCNRCRTSWRLQFKPRRVEKRLVPSIAVLQRAIASDVAEWLQVPLKVWAFHRVGWRGCEKMKIDMKNTENHVSR
jgi:hypothetical protein